MLQGGGGFGARSQQESASPALETGQHEVPGEVLRRTHKAPLLVKTIFGHLPSRSDAAAPMMLDVALPKPSSPALESQKE